MPSTSSATFDLPPSRPALAVTMGDPNGIGPEVIVNSLHDEALRNASRFIIFGSNEILLQAADSLGIEPFWWRVQRGSDIDASQIDPAEHTSQQVIVIDDDRIPATDFMLDQVWSRRPSKVGGKASLQYIADALHSTTLDPTHPLKTQGVVTAPISKMSWSLAGMKRFPGHTELFADFARVKRHAMMFVAPQLRVVLATIHVPLMDLRNLMTIGRVFDPIDMAHEACQNLFGIRQPRIAVCGLNPHASEGGLFGDEEYRVIEPAIRQAVDLGMNVKGPFPADTIFNAAVAGEFDVVIAMYHDQGTIPIKLLARDEAVNLTIGLPFIRTSPDHGTAFDIAGRGNASPGSMRASLQLASHLATRRRIQSCVHG